MPHMAMQQVVTTYTKDGNGDFTGLSSTVTNTDPCRFKVGCRPANCYMDFHNMASDILLGPESNEWDMSTGNHSEGICCIRDRLRYVEDPHFVGIVPTNPGICLRRSILVKLHTLWRLV